MSAWIRKLFYQAVLNPKFLTWYDRSKASKSLGDRGELAAERYLLRQGWVVLERGYQDKLGEIDLIAVDRRTVVFVEVKTRSGNSQEDPAEAVDRVKQTHLTRTAKGYLKWHHLEECRVRFDVIAVLWQPRPAQPTIIHYPNAFEAIGDFQMY